MVRHCKKITSRFVRSAPSPALPLLRGRSPDFPPYQGHSASAQLSARDQAEGSSRGIERGEVINLQALKRFQGLLLQAVWGTGLTAGSWLLMAQAALAHPSTGEPSLIHLLEHEVLTPSWVLTGLGLAVVLGAGHALSPGHGKTMAAAYLVGSRSTPWQAVVLGVTTTLTHTLAVFGLGAIALLAAQWGWSEQIYPVLSLVSGVMVVAVGSVLLRQRLNALESTEHHSQHHHLHAHAHTHDHHQHAHHSPAEQPNLIALGIAGGLVPCPSALVLLLSAIALHQATYGMALVTAFSLGLALVLVAVGLSVVYSRQWFDRLPVPSAVLRYLPIATAVMIMAVGAILTAQAIA